MSELLVPFEYEYMQRAIAVTGLVGAVCGLLSGYVVLKGWSLMGDALSHAVVPGVALAWMLGIPFAIGAFAAGMLAAGAMSMGVMFSAMFALGLVLLTQVPSNVHLSHVLFGSILGIEAEDVWQTVAVSGVALGILAVRGRDLLLWSFDPGQARACGLDVGRLRLLLLTVLAASIVAGVQAVGVILVVAMLITPGAIALLVTDRFGRLCGVAAGASCGSMAVGLHLSFVLDASAAGSIVLVLSVVFVGALVRWEVRRRGVAPGALGGGGETIVAPSRLGPSEPAAPSLPVSGERNL